MQIDNWALEACAHAAHETNRAYCRSLGDNTQQPWDSAPEWQKASAKDGVLSVFMDRGITAEQSHENWARHKLADGWKYGLVKDAEKREHPCLVSFGELPPEQQVKDKLFIAVVKSMLDTFWRQSQ